MMTPSIFTLILKWQRTSVPWG